jgi:hypothetical protein
MRLPHVLEVGVILIACASGVLAQEAATPDSSQYSRAEATTP